MSQVGSLRHLELISTAPVWKTWRSTPPKQNGPCTIKMHPERSVVKSAGGG